MKALIFVCMVFSLAMSVNVYGVETAEVDDGYLIVALSTSPVYFKSDGDAVIADYYKKYSAIYPDKTVIITRDSDVYFGLKYSRESNNPTKHAYFATKALERHANSIANAA